MAKPATYFDSETIALMKKALDEAWGSLPPKMQATMLKTALAARWSPQQMANAVVKDYEMWRWGTLPHKLIETSTAI